MNGRRPSGWAVFAAAVLAIAGAFNVVYGLAGILNDEYLEAAGQGVLIADYGFWGWVHLGFGAAMLWISYGLYTLNQTAQALAVILAMLNAVTMTALIGARPLWALTIIALDMAVIYNLTVKEGEHQPGG